MQQNSLELLSGIDLLLTILATMIIYIAAMFGWVYLIYRYINGGIKK